MTTFQRETIGRVRIHVLPTDRFKTFAMSVYVGYPLSEDTVTRTALVPFVLRRGTELYPETKAFREKLDDLYGAGFGFDIYKRGDYQLVQFRMDTINDRFVSDSRSLLAESLQYIGDAITAPALENGAFVAKYVTAEKGTLEKRIQSIINDKIRYAAERCTEEMFRGDPYRHHPLGKLEDLPSVGPQDLYEQYKKWLAGAHIDVYVCGQTSMEEVKPLVTKYLRLEAGTPEAYKQRAANRTNRDVHHVTERMEVSQGKLNMGLRTGVTYSDPLYPAALVYNGIFGGYPHAKLFMNVREKSSLAYYASSRLDGHKGVMMIQSGIEFEKYEQALEIIQEQLEAMRRGEISELEWNQTKAMIINQLREMQDSAFEMIAFDFNSVLSGKDRTSQSLIQDIEQVTVEDVRKVANQVTLDTVYFLRDKEGVAQA